MFITFIGIPDKIINLSAIALIEDESTETQSIVKLTTTDGTELEFINDDADAILNRCEALVAVTDKFITQMNGPSQN